MNFILNLFLFVIFQFKIQILFSQSFAPAPGNIGSTAIFKDSSIFCAWANSIQLQIGYLDISNKSLGYVSFGLPENALNKAEGNSTDVVSLGDSGIAILSFENPITNGEGFDFAIFENGFADNYVEYAFVEVSSDGINYVRFPNYSETPTTTQMGNFEFSDCRYVHNLAGKYRQGYGTPFDLEELQDSLHIDITSITHVKIIDVIGSINSQYGSFDSENRIINDPWPSAFESGGFDLDALGVIHQKELGIFEKHQFADFFQLQNGKIIFTKDGIKNLTFYDLTGKEISKSQIENSENSLLFIRFEYENQVFSFKILTYQ
jgi:hypothetical protein